MSDQHYNTLYKAFKKYNTKAKVDYRSKASAQSILKTKMSINFIEDMSDDQKDEAIKIVNRMIANYSGNLVCVTCGSSGSRKNFFSPDCCLTCDKKRKTKAIETRRRERMRTDPMYAMMTRARSRTSAAIVQMGYTKKSRTAYLLGCDWETLKTHIESKFKDGMSWANKGEWHIDHIIPVSLAKTEDELMKLLHYTNLQPMWAMENWQKSNRLQK